MSSPTRRQRYSLLLPLRVWMRTWGKRRLPAPESAEETITTNISSAGCYFVMSREPPVGSAINVEIALASELGEKPRGKVVASGKIVRVERQPETGKIGVACSFDHQHLLPTSGHTK